MTNPLMSVSELDNELPDFANLRDEHYFCLLYISDAADE